MRTTEIPVSTPRGIMHDYSGSQPVISDKFADATMDLPGCDIRAVYANIAPETAHFHIETDEIIPKPGITIQYTVSVKLDSRTTLRISAVFIGGADNEFSPDSDNCTVEITRGSTRLLQVSRAGKSISSDTAVEMAIPVKTISGYISTDKQYVAVVVTRTVIENRMNVIVDETASFTLLFPGPALPGANP